MGIGRDMQKMAARALKDMQELGVPLSAEDAALLQLAASGEMQRSHGGLGRLWPIFERNPRQDLYDARAAARELLHMLGDWLTDEDRAFALSVRHRKDVTCQQVNEARERAAEARSRHWALLRSQGRVSHDDLM